MSPLKSKQNEKNLSKEKKVPSKQALSSVGMSVSAYNPMSGTFHSLLADPMGPAPSTATPNNGKFKLIDDTDHSYDSVSNNGSYSGESDDHHHMILTNGQDNKQMLSKKEILPGMSECLDKQAKARNRNEKKHQRQKEKRAQELKDRCSGYLMSRRLETLAHQLVSMGFSSERATMALILNEGDLEHSVSWLLEGGEAQQPKGDWIGDGINLKMDISSELACIAEWKFKYKFTQPDIERAIVSCEGDLDKALELLRSKKITSSPESGAQEFKPIIKDSPNNNKPLPPLSPTPKSFRHVGSVSSTQVDYQHKREEQAAYLLSKGRQKKQQQQQQQQHHHHHHHHQQQQQQQQQHCPLSTDRSLLIPSPKRENPSSSLSVQWPRPLSPTDKQQSMHSNNGGIMPVFDAGFTSAQSPPFEPKWANSNPSEPSHSFQLFPSKHTPSVNANPLVAASISPSDGWNDSKLFGTRAPVEKLGWGRDISNLMCEDYNHHHHGNNNNIDVKLQGEYHSLLPTEVGGSWSSNRNGFMPVVDDTPNRSFGPPLSTVLQSETPLPNSTSLFTGWGGRGLNESFSDWNTGLIVNCDYRNIDWSMTPSPSKSWDIAAVSQEFSTGLTSLKLSEDLKSGLKKPSKQQVFNNNPCEAADNNTNSNQWPQVETGNNNNNVAKGANEWTSPFAGKELFTPSCSSQQWHG